MNPENLTDKGFDKRPQNINKKGRPKVLPELKDVLTELLSEEQKGMTALEAVLKRLIVRAIGGDTRAAQELLDRYYGKSKQNIDLSTLGQPLSINVNFMPDE